MLCLAELMSFCGQKEGSFCPGGAVGKNILRALSAKLCSMDKALTCFSSGLPEPTFTADPTEKPKQAMLWNCNFICYLHPNWLPMAEESKECLYPLGCETGMSAAKLA